MFAWLFSHLATSAINSWITMASAPHLPSYAGQTVKQAKLDYESKEEKETECFETQCVGPLHYQA